MVDRTLLDHHRRRRTHRMDLVAAKGIVEDIRMPDYIRVTAVVIVRIHLHHQHNSFVVVAVSFQLDYLVPVPV
jgi:hypothetical protein